MVSADSMWTTLTTYTTVKKCKIVDAKIALSHKFVTLGIFAYIIWNLISSYGYAKQEAPSAVVNAYVAQADFLETVAELSASPPDFCDNAETDFEYGGGWVYEDNQCDFDLKLGDVLTKTEQAVFITTYFQDTPVDETTANAAGLVAGNYFVPGIDHMRLVWDHQVSTTWGSVVSNPALELRRLGDDATSSPRVSYEKDSEVGISIADLLTLAGADLDAVNSNTATGPLFRLSGTHVKIHMQYSNLHSDGSSFDVGKAKADVSYSTGGVWTSLGPKMIYKKDATGALHQFQRYHYVLRVSFVLSGQIGVFDFFTLLLNLAVATGMLGVAVVIVDGISEKLVSNFDDQKYDDRNDFMTLESLKEYALSEGILDKYAEKTGMKLLDDDVMKGIRERNQKIQNNWKKPKLGKSVSMLNKVNNKVAAQGVEQGGGSGGAAP